MCARLFSVRLWTDDGKLRHASFKGIRELGDDATVFALLQRTIYIQRHPVVANFTRLIDK
jgi:hypothetical protein